MWNPKTLSIKCETLGNAHYAIDYLRSPSVYRLSEKVAIIGAGNVAMDAARTTKANGAKEVTFIYRKGFEQMSATKREIEEAKEDGIMFNLHGSPIEIKENGVPFQFKDNDDLKEEFFNVTQQLLQ